MIKIEITDSRYPKILKNIKDPPKQLYLEGDYKLLQENSIAIIGSRNCTENGEFLSKKFASELAEQGITIVSGMAKGIDSFAHQGCLGANGKTIAVLGCGLNNIYPKENIGLYKKIIRKGGLIISEYPPDTEAKSELFLERNRIVSGLSLGILVIEAIKRSGTSVTARLARNQGRKVFVLPHEIADTHGVGTNRLIKQGAILVTDVQDIFKEFDFLEYKKIPKKVETSQKYKKDRNINQIKFSNDEQEKIYRLIEHEINTINEIYNKVNIPINRLNQELFLLEVEGYIKKKEGVYKCV